MVMVPNSQGLAISSDQEKPAPPGRRTSIALLFAAARVFSVLVLSVLLISLLVLFRNNAMFYEPYDVSRQKTMHTKYSWQLE